MLKKTITYTDFNDVERTEDFYFNLTEAELQEMHLSVDGGMDVYLKRIVNSKNVPQLMSEFKKLLLKAYGIKSDDGRRFMKSEEISKEFEQTEAYSVLFMELTSDADKSAAFFNALIPKKLAARLEEMKKDPEFAAQLPKIDA